MLLTEDDSALKVASQITFGKLITYKLVAYKKRCLYEKIVSQLKSFYERLQKAYCDVNFVSRHDQLVSNQIKALQQILVLVVCGTPKIPYMNFKI